MTERLEGRWFIENDNFHVLVTNEQHPDDGKPVQIQLKNGNYRTGKLGEQVTTATIYRFIPDWPYEKKADQ
mgnify:CR=1 FL=1